MITSEEFFDRQTMNAHADAEMYPRSGIGLDTIDRKGQAIPVFRWGTARRCFSRSAE